jgi:hypothetical protein
MRKTILRPLDSLLAPRWLLLALGALCLVLPMLVWFYQVNTPSDGARMAKLPDATNPLGIYIDVLSGSSRLQDGDLVTAVQGVPMATWVEGLRHPENWKFRWEWGEAIQFQVIRQGNPVDVAVILGRQPVRAILVNNWSVLLFTVVFQFVAIFILIQKPREPAAQALFLWGMTTSHFYVWSTYLQIYDFVNGYGFWLYTIVASFLWLSTWPANLHLALTFPTPLPTLRRRPRLIWMLYPASYLIYLLYLAVSHIIIPSQLEWIGRWNRGDTLVAMVMFIPAVLAMLRQFHLHRSGPERQKIQWVVFSGLFAGSMAMILYLVPEFLGQPRVGVNAVGLFLIPFPLAIALAIWRYQLFDINLIINRTLVYGTLTLTLGLLFFSGVTLLQQAFGIITGTTNSPIAIVISTLIISALFNPLRIRIQNFIDRRFYRRKYDAQKTLERFAAKARDETDIEQLSAGLVVVVEETMQPESVSLWLIPSDKK